VRVIQPNSVAEFEGDVRASFGGSVARSKKGTRVRARCSDSSSDAGDGIERTGSCAGIGVASVRGRPGGGTGEGKEACKADGGRAADGS